MPPKGPSFPTAFLVSLAPDFMTCTTCLETKTRDCFAIRHGHGRPTAYYKQCKKCRLKKTVAWAARNQNIVKQVQRKHLLAKKYGLSDEEYEAILRQQGNCCAVCGDTPSPVKRKFPVDHDHSLPKEYKRLAVRGILCDRCNRVIGLIHEDISLLLNAVRYLENHKNHIKKTLDG